MNELQLFFRRIGMEPDTPAEPSLDLLGKVQTGCVLSIAYENLDILAGRPLSLAPEALYDKIVVRGRGGYCFELNGLLTHMLGEMGFSVSERFARFLRGEPEVPMRRHRVTVVELDGDNYFCDIGVGQIAPRLPLKMEPGLIQTQGAETYRFERDPRHGWILWELHHGQWREYLAVPEDVAYPVDFIQPSFFCEAHPDSVFNKAPMIAIKTPEGRRTIDGRVYKEFCGEKLTHLEEDISDARMEELLETVFRITPQR